jgi:hypothetical protein
MSNEQKLWAWFQREFSMRLADPEPIYKIMTKDQLDAGYVLRTPAGPVSRLYISSIKCRSGLYLVALPSERWNNERIVSELRMAGSALIEREMRGKGASAEEILARIDEGVLP